MTRAAKDIERAIAEVRATFPDLGMGGFGVGLDRTFDQAQIETAIAFLHLCQKTKRADIFSSYTLKHIAEAWGKSVGREPYIANGAMIFAALTLDFGVKRHSGSSPNASIGIDRRSIEKIQQRLHYDAMRSAS